MEWHLVAWPNKHAKKKNWRAWKWDSHKKKKIWRWTGQNRKIDALSVVEQWEAEEKSRSSGLLREYAQDFFVPGKCPFLRKRKHLKEQTIYHYRKDLEKILERWGDTYLADIKPVPVETWIDTLTYGKQGQHAYSGSAKNHLLETFSIILRQAYREELIPGLPAFERFERDTVKPDILTQEEIKTLFPQDELDLAQIWGELGGGIMHLAILHAGMRPGEGRALHAEQIYPEHNTVLIDRQLDSFGKLSVVKKAKKDDLRIRFSRVSAHTMEKIVSYKKHQEIEKGYLFVFEGAPWTDEHQRWIWNAALKKAGITTEGRKLVPYSLRYTFRSIMHGKMELERIMQLMGHRSEEMSRHYNRINPEQFQTFDEYQDIIDSVWS